MNFISNKAILIGVGIFATLMITTAVFILLGYVLDIYGNIAKIDYSTIMSMDEFARYNITSYDGSRFTSSETFTGVEVYNMINKYKNDERVYINGGSLTSYKENLLTNINTDKNLRAKYYCTVVTNTEDKIEIRYQIAST